VVDPDLEGAARHPVGLAQQRVAEKPGANPLESKLGPPAERRMRTAHFVDGVGDGAILLGYQPGEVLDFSEEFLLHRHRLVLSVIEGPALSSVEGPALSVVKRLASLSAHEGCTEISTGSQTCPWMALPEGGGDTVTTSALSIQSKYALVYRSAAIALLTL